MSQDLLNRGVRGGRSSQNDLIRIRSDIQTRQPTVTQRQLARELSYDYLRMLIGYDDEQALVLDDKLLIEKALPKDSDLIRKMNANQAIIKTLQKKIEFHQLSADATKAKYNPSIGAFGSLNYNAQSDEVTAENLQSFTAAAVRTPAQLHPI